MDFSSQIQTVSEDMLNSLFSEEPKTKAPEKVEVTEKKDENFVKEEIPFIEDLESIEKPAEKKDEEKSDNKDGAKEPEKKKEEEEKAPENIEEIKSVLKNTTNYLIEKGIWSDFEGREELDLDENTYAELSAKQAEAQVQELFSELVDSTGDYGKAIISHIKNGGNPDEIIDIFKEQKQIESLDVSKDIPAEKLVEKYYSEVVGWSDAKIKRYVDSLKAEEDGLSNEATEVQSKFKEIYDAQLAKITAQQKEQQKAKEEENRQYLSTLAQTIDSFENFTEEDKKLIKNSVFKTTKKINGVAVNEFFAKFYDIQKDPKKYVELIHYVMAPEKYKSKIEAQEQKKITAKQWNFVKGNAAVKSTNTQKAEDPAKTSTLDFSGIVFKKR